MDLVEVKYEFEYDSRLQCRTCLSVGRKLTPLGQYIIIFKKLINDVEVFENLVTQPIEICWECQSLLRKVLLFQQQVKTVCELFLTNQNFTNGPLSNLASITLNDTHQTVYLNACNVHIHSKSTENNCKIFNNTLKEKDTPEVSKMSIINEMKIQNEKYSHTKRVVHKSSYDKNLENIKINRNLTLADNNHCDRSVNKVDLNMRKGCGADILPLERPAFNKSDINLKYGKNIGINTQIDMEKVNGLKGNTSEDENDLENDFNVQTSNLNYTRDIKTKSKSKSRWAVKRAAQNKKPKFEIVSTDFHEAFTKVQINNEELAECLAQERNSEYYKSKRFKCESCVLGFSNDKQWLVHNEIHHSDKLPGYTCDICKTKIIDKRHLSGHITQHYNVFKCTICQLICRNEGIRNWHFHHKHKKMFRCLKCGLKFSVRRELFKHYKDSHDKYVCDHCGVSFKMRYCIKKHIRKQHSPFTCLPCNRTFARYNGLWLHRKLTHSPVSPPAYCVECNTEYKDTYRYKWHLCNSVKHTPKKKLSIPCPDCKKTFTKRIYMKNHHDFVHLKLYRHRCQPCEKNFIRNAELVKHRRRKHEGILPPRNKICYLCGRGFTTNKILRNHLRTHETHVIDTRKDTSKEN